MVMARYVTGFEDIKLPMSGNRDYCWDYRILVQKTQLLGRLSQLFDTDSISGSDMFSLEARTSILQWFQYL
jgi:hypothetical protein